MLAVGLLNAAIVFGLGSTNAMGL